MGNVSVVSILTGKTIFTGTLAQCEWFIDVKSLTIYADNDSGDTFWVK